MEINRAFWHQLDQFGDANCLIGGAQPLSYRTVAAKADQVTADLPTRKSLVLLQIDNSIDAITSYLGILRGGHAILLCEAGNDALAETLRDTYCPEFECLQATDGFEVISTGLAGPELHHDLAMVISTSGSSGTAKAVRLSYENLESNARAIAQYLSLDADERALLTLPLHYCYGLSVVNSHLAVGASLVTGRSDPSAPSFFDRLNEKSATSFAGVPYTFETLERRKFREQSFPSLRYVTQAGGRLQDDLVRAYGKWAAESQKRFFVMYGQTEATARISYLPPEKLLSSVGSIGEAIPGGRITLCREDGTPVARGEQGEINYEGPNVMLGYAEAREDLAGGRDSFKLLTGDLAVEGEDGFFRIVGRKSRFSKIFGVRLNLDQVESFLASQGQQAKVVSDDKSLFVVSEGQALDSDLVATLSDEFNVPATNISLRAIDALPLLPSGKVDTRSLLSTMVLESETSRYEANAGGGTQRERIINLYKEHFPNQDLSESDSFVSLDGDSMRFVSISLGIEEILGELPDRWEQLSISDLSKVQSKERRFWASIESSIYLRALAPLAIVLNHAGNTVFRGGAAALLVLAGYNFYRFQWRQFLDGNILRAWSTILVNILIPYWAILISYQILMGEVEWQNILLIGYITELGDAKKPFVLWFIQALIQTILVLTLPLIIPAVRNWARQNEFLYISIACLVMVSTRLLGEPYLFGEYVNAQNGQHVLWAWWLFAIGMFLSTWRYRADATPVPVPNGKLNIWAIAISIAVTLIAWRFYDTDTSRAVAVSLTVLVLIWAPHLPIPRIAIPTISVLAASSYFIYMMHGRGRIVGWSEALPVDIVRVGSGVLFGVVTWKLYTMGEVQVRRWFNKFNEMRRE
ncbi:MAG: AMP-binding protein [Pseudomonadota bacterium]